MSPLPEKWQSFGFAVHEVDGHDIKAVDELLKTIPVDLQKPTVVICHTIKGKGFPFAEGNPNWHHKSKLTKQEIESMYSALL